MTNLFLLIIGVGMGSFFYARNDAPLAYIMFGIAIVNLFVYIAEHLPVTERQIRTRAELVWIREGRPEGRELEHWQKAKEEMRWN